MWRSVQFHQTSPRTDQSPCLPHSARQPAHEQSPTHPDPHPVSSKRSKSLKQKICSNDWIKNWRACTHFELIFLQLTITVLWVSICQCFEHKIYLLLSWYSNIWTIIMLRDWQFCNWIKFSFFFSLVFKTLLFLCFDSRNLSFFFTQFQFWVRSQYLRSSHRSPVAPGGHTQTATPSSSTQVLSFSHSIVSQLLTSINH